MLNECRLLTVFYISLNNHLFCFKEKQYIMLARINPCQSVLILSQKLNEYVNLYVSLIVPYLTQIE